MRYARLGSALAYAAAALIYVWSEPPLAIIAVVLLGWLLGLTRAEQQLMPNDGPWNHPDALQLHFVTLPTALFGLSTFAPVYLSWAIAP